MTSEKIPVGKCQCGCGKDTTLADKTDRLAGKIKGQPMKFCKGHKSKSYSGVSHHSWKGGSTKNGNGYIWIRCPNHPKANHGYVQEHTYVMEQEIGRLLNKKEIVHHIDGNKANNNINNLMLCRDTAQHFKIHADQRALEACGHKTWRKCPYCKKYDSTLRMFQHHTSSYYHQECFNKHRRVKRLEYKFRET